MKTNFKANQRRFWVIVVSLFFMMVCGCVSSKVLSAVDNVTSSAEKRAEMLQERLDKFNNSLYWGSVDEAVEFVSPEVRTEFMRNASSNRSVEQYVELKVEDLDMKNPTTAEVRLKIKYFKQAHYVVQTRVEKQIWDFRSFQGGWYLVSSELVPSEKEPSNNADTQYKGLTPTKGEDAWIYQDGGKN